MGQCRKYIQGYNIKYLTQNLFLTVAQKIGQLLLIFQMKKHLKYRWLSHVFMGDSTLERRGFA